MLDERLMGMRFIFTYPNIKVTNLGELCDVVVSAKGEVTLVDGDYNTYCAKDCRIAQGDKMTYDGSGQPVPDGVSVKVWSNNSGPMTLTTGGLVWSDHNIRFSGITHFQVQEMPVEHPLAYLANKQEPLGADFQKVIDDNFEELVEATPLEQLISINGGLAKTFREVKPETTAITTKLHSEIVEYMQRERAMYLELESFGQIAVLDKILEQLGEGK